MNSLPSVILLFQLVKFSATFWDESNPLILNQDENGNHSFPTFVENFVYVSSQQNTLETYFYCPTFKGINKYCLYGEKLEKGKNKYCLEQVQPYMGTISKNGENVECGGTTKGVLFSFSYRLCYEEKNREVDIIQIYKLCFDRDSKKMIYASFTIDEPSLLTNKDLKYEQNYKFQFSDEGFEHFGKYYNSMAFLYDQGKDRYKAQTIAPPEFMSFGLTRKPFFHYVNVAPMNKDLIKPWNEFLSNLRELIIKQGDPLEVYSGVHGIVAENGFLRYLLGDNISVPFFWWIVLQDTREENKRGISFIMHNRAYGPQENKNLLMCKESVCDEEIVQRVIPKDDHVLMYCCPVTSISDKIRIDPATQFMKFN